MTIRLFGAPDVRVDGQPVTGARSIALIAVLAVAPDMRVSRSVLADLLWSDQGAGRGRANLRQLLHALRHSIGDAFGALFDLSRDTVALHRDRVTLLGGPQEGLFLDGLDVPQEGFEEWLRDHRLGQPIGAARLPVAEPDPAVLPRIMVFPFNALPDAGVSGLGDALAHDLTTQFACSQLIDAISYFSSRAFAAPGAQTAATADFALTGQVRLVQGTLRVDATLVDLADNRVLWSDRYKTGLRDYLSGADDLAGQITGQALRIIMSRSIAASSSAPLPELDAHVLMLSAVALMHSFDKRHFHRAQAQLEAVIARCPGHSVPRAWLAQWHVLRIFQKWTDDPGRDTMAATAAIRNALDMNATCPLSLAIDGNIHTLLHADFTTARHRYDAACEINPSSAFISQIAAVLETFCGNGREAVALSDRALLLSPRDPRRPFFQTMSAGAYVVGGRYDEAVAMAEASLRHNPFHLSAHRCRVIGLQLAGREAEARKAAQALLRVDPGMTVSGYLRTHPAAQNEISRTWADAMQQAGIPVN